MFIQSWKVATSVTMTPKRILQESFPFTTYTITWKFAKSSHTHQETTFNLIKSNKTLPNHKTYLQTSYFFQQITQSWALVMLVHKIFAFFSISKKAQQVIVNICIRNLNHERRYWHWQRVTHQFLKDCPTLTILNNCQTLS